MKLNEKQLRSVIIAEVKRLIEDSQSVDPSAIKHVVVNAEKLLSAVSAFMNNASDEMKSALGDLDDVKKTLENMLSAPGSYVAKPSPQAKVVSFKAVKPE